MSNAQWFVVETRPRAESSALAEIASMGGFEAYLPQETRLRRTRKGRFVVQQPLLPGFIFVNAAGRSIFDVLKCQSVRSLIRSGGTVHPIRPLLIDGTHRHFVDELRSRENAGEFDFTPKEKTLVAGGDVRVMTGFFKDSIGRLLSAPTDGRAEIMMEGLFNGRMTVDVRNLEGFDRNAAA